MSQPSTSQIKTQNGISWYCERSGSGPDIVLIPSGEGDCESFAKVTTLLSTSFRVTTFDMPGMSRTTAPKSAMTSISASKIASQIIGLLDELSITEATFWGCSSGGLVALALAADHPARVRNVVVHEVPLNVPPEGIRALGNLDDKAISLTCRDVFANMFAEDAEKWHALSEAYHERLDRNFVTWVRTYVGKVERGFSKEELTRRPVKWTIGALTPAGMFWQNVVDGFAAGIQVGVLPSKHFPQVTVPEVLAEHIRGAVEECL